MRPRRKQGKSPREGHIPSELEIEVLRTQIAFRADKNGFKFILDRAEVTGLVFFEASNTLQIAMHHGSSVSLGCTLEDAMFLAVRLLPEERDGDFMYQPAAGPQYCAWDDLR
ncbi:hypothetical protein R8510_04036 [Ralstonia chuxiongensis]|nr:hypothetical protein R8510_04036 [Ralstonia chuxiongensis]